MRKYLVLKERFEHEKKISQENTNELRVKFLFPESYTWDSEELTAEYSEMKGDQWRKSLAGQGEVEGELPLLAYAIAGIDFDVPSYPPRYIWLLNEVLKKVSPVFPIYQHLSWSFVSIAAAFGRIESLKLLLENNYFQPTDNEYQTCLFFAAFYGHEAFFEFITNEHFVENTNLSALCDSGHTLLHVAVAGAHASNDLSMLLSLLRKGININKEAVNESVKLGNLAIFMQIEAIKNRRHEPFSTEDYKNFITLLITESQAEAQAQFDMFQHLYQKNADNIDNWIKVATNRSKTELVAKILANFSGKHNSFDTLVSHAESSNQDEIKQMVFDEMQFNSWLNDVKSNISEKIEQYIQAYYDGDKKQLELMAKEDKVSEGYTHSEKFLSLAVANLLSTKKPTEKSERKNKRNEALESFFIDYRQKLRDVFIKMDMSPSDQVDSKVFMEKIILKREILFNYLKKDAPSKEDIHDFHHALWEMLSGIKVIAVEEKKTEDSKASTDDLSHTESERQPAASYYNNFMRSDVQLTRKQLKFIEKFSEYFDKTHMCFLFVYTEELMRPPDSTDRLANLAKEAAKLLPDFKLNLAMFGLPVPLTVAFPTAVTIAAVIDLCLFFRDRSRKAKAGRITDYFCGATYGDKVRMIYDAAYSIADIWADQLEVLESDALANFAELAVARLFQYMGASNANIESDAPHWFGTFMRAVASYVIPQSTGLVRPEPETIHKPLSQIGHEATTIQEHALIFQNNEEKKNMILETGYRDLNNTQKQWTAKGIFELTGICIKERDRITYYGYSEADVEKYGYRKGTHEEAHDRGMTNLTSKNVVPLFKKREGWSNASNFSGNDNFFPGRNSSRSNNPAQLVARGAPLNLR